MLENLLSTQDQIDAALGQLNALASIGTPGALAEASTTITPSVTAKDGKASVSLASADMAAAIESAKATKGSTIIIQPQITGTASKIVVTVPTASLSMLADQTDAGMELQTPSGIVSLSHDVLLSLLPQALGTNVSISLETADKAALTAAQQAAAGDGTVYDISISSGNKPVTSFGGKAITISLPYTLRSGESAEGVTVWYLSEGGGLEAVSSTYDAATGLATFKTSHLSFYVVGYTAWANPFTDVAGADWYYSAVQFVFENSLMNGISKDSFSPNGTMTRSMLVTALHRMEGMPSATGANPFTDVPADQWYTDPVLWARESGIVNGYTDTQFAPNDSITREQLATILFRYAELKKYRTAERSNLEAFAEAPGISPYALDAMKWANAEGLINGRTATTLAPAGTATRGEVAAMLMRFVQGVVQ